MFKFHVKEILIEILKKIHVYGVVICFYNGIQKRCLPKWVLEARKKRLIDAIKFSSNRLQSLPVKKVIKREGEPLRIAQINTCDNIGGAALVAFRLHKAYKKQGHRSFMLVGDKQSGDDNVISIRDNRDTQFLGICNREGLQYWNYLSSFDIPLKEEFSGADLFHCHNLHGDYFNYYALPGLTRLKPAIWTLHDMEALTGHCAFSLDCEKWQSGCGKCPMLYAYPPIEKDTTSLLWQGKKEIFTRSDIDIVVPSKWLFDIVKKGILADKEIHLIPNGIDTGIFHPYPKAEMRERFNLPFNKVVFITSASGGTKNPQKGGTYLLEALKKIRIKEDVVLVSLGDTNYNPGIEGVNWVSTGHIYEEAEVAKWYSAADIFLYPSIADNLPLAVLEAMSCGLPIVTFDTGGIPEMVRHMDNGYVAGYKDVLSLIKGMELFLYDTALREKAGRHAMEAVRKNFTIERMVNSYLELYYNVIAKRASKQAMDS